MPVAGIIRPAPGQGTGRVYRNNAWLKNRTAALNLRNLIARGLGRQNGTWALA